MVILPFAELRGQIWSNEYQLRNSCEDYTVHMDILTCECLHNATIFTYTWVIASRTANFGNIINNVLALFSHVDKIAQAS